MEESHFFRGIAVYPGLVYAPVHRWKTKRPSTRVINSKTDSDAELKILKQSLKKTEETISQLIKDQGDENRELKSILESQVLFLNDPIFRAKIAERISVDMETADIAIETVVSSLFEEFQSIADEFFSERADHLLDIGKQLTQNLDPGFKNEKQTIPYGSILVAKEITPSELISIDKNNLFGIATDFGGKTGHMAIIARSFGIPTVVGLKHLSTNTEDQEMILLDGSKGTVKRNPSLLEYQLHGIQSRVQSTVETHRPVPKTKDGAIIELKVNVDTPEEAELANEQGVDGIGLVRTEILFLPYGNTRPTEEEQFEIYKRILKSQTGKPVTFRVWDVGADKMEVGYTEANPFLGSRGIRYLLRHPGFFKEQIRALLRVSNYGTLKVLIPMVCTLQEILEARRFWRECEAELASEGIAFSKHIPIGIMVETPASALNLAFLGKEVDFYSVGTNDLLQYLLAVERNNHLVSDLYNPLQLVFLLLLKNLAETAKSQNKPISICGEMASDPNMIPILIGMGYRDLSCALPLLPSIKEAIGKIAKWKAKEMVSEVIELSSQEKFQSIEELLLQSLKFGN